MERARAMRVALVAAALLLVLGMRTPLAAVRLCKGPVSSGPVMGSNEETARAAALAVWKSKALVHGEPYASWRIAADKILECLPRDGGGYECLARARPCTIEQAPDRRHLRRNRLRI